jgi:hypothetical protein
MSNEIQPKVEDVLESQPISVEAAHAFLGRFLVSDNFVDDAQNASNLDMNDTPLDGEGEEDPFGYGKSDEHNNPEMKYSLVTEEELAARLHSVYESLGGGGGTQPHRRLGGGTKPMASLSDLINTSTPSKAVEVVEESLIQEQQEVPLVTTPSIQPLVKEEDGSPTGDLVASGFSSRQSRKKEKDEEKSAKKAQKKERKEAKKRKKSMEKETPSKRIKTEINL